MSGSLLIELGRLVEIKGPTRYLDVLDSLKDFEIQFKKKAMDKVWELSQVYLSGNALTARHTVDLLHYAAASLLGCVYLASWNSRQFNEKVAAKVNRINSRQGLPNLIAGSPNYIIKGGNLGQGKAQ